MKALLPFAVEEFGDECWLYGSDIPHGDRLVDSVGVFLERTDIGEDTKRKLLVDNVARFYGLDPETGARKGVSGGREGAVSRATRSPAPRVSLRRRWWPRTRLFRDP